MIFKCKYEPTEAIRSGKEGDDFLENMSRRHDVGIADFITRFESSSKQLENAIGTLDVVPTRRPPGRSPSTSTRH